ncbi:MAG TPA: hypothetical protein VGI10_13535 [Polyangiaceae bacterium]
MRVRIREEQSIGLKIRGPLALRLAWLPLALSGLSACAGSSRAAPDGAGGSFAGSASGGGNLSNGGGSGSVSSGGASGSVSSGGASGSGGSSGQATTLGVCAPTCPKSCATDDACATQNGEKCCNFPTGGVCTLASACPVFCTSDADCPTSLGQACLQTTVGAPKVCTTPASAFQTCQTDTNCSVAGDVCCQIYTQNVCMPPSTCPKSCAADAECDPTRGEACCLTVRRLEPRLKVQGLCLSATSGSCPKACTTSIDCTGQLCCNGICATTCTQTCETSNDCSGEICCKVQTSTPPLVEFSIAQACSGSPLYPCSTLCAQPGCNQTGGGATCANYPSGCLYSPDPTSCAQHLGCSWDGLECTGTPTNCATLHVDETSCYADLDCEWNLGNSSCSGTPTPCAQLTSIACSSVYGCTLSSGGLTPL